MAVNVVPSAVTIDGTLSSSEPFLTGAPSYLADATAYRVPCFVAEYGNLVLVFSSVLLETVTGLAREDIIDIEPGYRLDSIAGLSNQELSIAPSRTKLSDTGRSTLVWYVSAINPV